MTHNESSTAADAITAATVLGFHAFMATEAKAAMTDTQLETAATKAHAGPGSTLPNQGPNCRSKPSHPSYI